MKNTFLAAAAIFTGMTLNAAATPDATDDFDAELIRSGYIHTLLPLHRENSLEARGADKKVLTDTPLDISRGWRHEGEGSLAVLSDSGYVRLSYPTLTGRRAVGPEGDRDYALFGHSAARYDMGGANLEPYNRISFDITPVCPGMRVVNVNFYMANDSHEHKPGYNQPTGHHLINLENGRTNHCSLEIADLQRDRVGELLFSFSLNGRDITTGDTAAYIISNIRLQQVVGPDKVSGWDPRQDKIIYAMTGYACDGRKTAVTDAAACASSASFTVERVSDGQPVYTDKIKKVKTTIGEFGVIDFSKLTEPGEYRICAAGMTTEPFKIGGREIWDRSQWRVLNGIYGQRCGYHVPGIHGRCHTDLFAVHDGIKIPYSGGWHDAGDLSQQTLQSADIYYDLLEAAEAAEAHNPALAARLREEALWGIDFCLRCRFGDGYRASSMGLLIWQDGITDSYDDITSVRVQNVSFDNYLHAAYEAYAAMHLHTDPMLCDYLTRIAREDFDFAEQEFARTGPGGWISVMEHTYNTSMSQMMATISWAASRLYELTGEQRYADRAAEAGEYVLACQQTTPIDGQQQLCGFFYRDKDRRSLVHYIHQSREQIYMQALQALCATQPDNPARAHWEQCARLYGDYLKGLMQYTAPYGMLPGGVYRDDEYLDTDAFERLHLFAPSNAVDLYKKQFAAGVPLGKHHALKRFPIWFSIFNGNIVIHTSMGKAAAICGNMLNDPELRDIAREQLYWIVGKNPFGQSLIYGEGHDYPMMNSFSSGEITGEMPVGIRSLGNSDQPYWPQINNACYKEVWVTSAGKWLSLISEL